MEFFSNDIEFDFETCIMTCNHTTYFQSEEIDSILKFSIWAGWRKGDKKGHGLIKRREDIPCYLNVIQVNSRVGCDKHSTYFYDRQKYYDRIKEDVGGGELLSRDRLRALEDEGQLNNTDTLDLFGRDTKIKNVSYSSVFKIIQKASGPSYEFFKDMGFLTADLYRYGSSGELVKYFTVHWMGERVDRCVSVCVENANMDILYEQLCQLKSAEQELKKREETERLERIKRESAERMERLEREKREKAERLEREKREEAERVERERLRREEAKRRAEQKLRQAGKKGEAEVDYVIKWLMTQGYRTFPKKCGGKYGNESIWLRNPAFIDETQEYDHIVVGPQGVFVIETKYYAGKLIVNQSGNWIRVKDGVEKGEVSPVQQMRRHEKLLSSFLPEKIPIIPIICIAHPEAIIEGEKHCVVPIVKSDLLGDFIENYPAGDKILSEAEITECLNQMEKYRYME